MTVEEAKAQFSEASTAELTKAGYIRNGNWEPIARALRHPIDRLEKVEHDGAATVLKVTPKSPPKTPAKAGDAAIPKGKTPMVRPPYYLIVT